MLVQGVWLLQTQLTSLAGQPEASQVTAPNSPVPPLQGSLRNVVSGWIVKFPVEVMDKERSNRGPSLSVTHLIWKILN